MKGILVIIDGLGDLPNKKLDGKTPLEAAEKTNLDYLAKKSKLGYLYPVKEKFVPGTSEGVVSIFEQHWQEYPRGWLEALGVGIKLQRGDLALRTNFATIDNLKNRNIIDRRAGRTLTTREARALSKTLNKKIKLPCKFEFRNTLQHRGVLVFKGSFSDMITDTDSAHYSKVKKEQGKFRFSTPEDDDEVAIYSANVLNNFLEQSYNLLDQHPVNKYRRKEKMLPANIIITRAGGTEVRQINKFKNWACATDVPVMNGICRSLGMKVYEFSGYSVKGKDPYKTLKKNLKLGIRKSLKIIRKKSKVFDYFLVYIKETDSAGHDNLPLIKKDMIELIDKMLFSSLRKLEKKKIKIVVTADHSTPCKLKAHSADPVPVMFCDWEGGGEDSFGERNCKKGKFGKLVGKELLKKVGFVK